MHLAQSTALPFGYTPANTYGEIRNTSRYMIENNNSAIRLEGNCIVFSEVGEMEDELGESY